MEQLPPAVSISEYRRRSAHEPGAMLFETARNPKTAMPRSYFFEHPVRWIETQTLDQTAQVFASIEEALDKGLWVAGYLSYECGYHWEPKAASHFKPKAPLPLAAFGIYHAPVVPTRDAREQLGCGLADIKLSLSLPQFKERFNRIQQWIAAGDTYQVNLTSRVESAYSHGAETLFAHMMQQQPVEFGAMLNINGRMILSASPELFFQKLGSGLRLRPMKGTSPRGRDQAEDDHLAAALAADEKNRAENVMIVDLLRSDVGRVAETGSVRMGDLFKVEHHPSLLQMTSTITATLRGHVNFYQLFRAIFPSGSIVGAPKVRTMQIIRELEGQERSVYTGAIGYITPERDAVFSVAIRTAVLENGRLSMGVGAGITSGSNAELEYKECLLKAEFLRDRSFELIETMRWEEERCELLELHLQRMESSAKYFNFAFDRQSILSAIAGYAAQLSSQIVWKLRLVMTSTGACSFSAKPLQEENAAKLQARLWPQPMQSTDPWLRHKTTRRYIYDKARLAAQKAHCVDAIFLNEFGMVTEGAIHSILVRHGSTWRTPPLSAGVLPGVYRRHLLSTRPEILEQDIHVDELWTADQVYLMNAVRGLRRVESQQQLLDSDDENFRQAPSQNPRPLR